MDASDSSSPDKAVGALSDVLGYMGTVMLIVTRAAGIKACMVQAWEATYPGSGLKLAWSRHGKLTWQRLVQPAATWIRACMVQAWEATYPGSGLELAWSRHGRLPWQRLVRPAAALARNGYKAYPQLVRVLSEPEILTRVKVRTVIAGVHSDRQGAHMIVKVCTVIVKVCTVIAGVHSDRQGVHSDCQGVHSDCTGSAAQ
eukprot:1160899-Pelagomonas_calceolata.AAC.9